MTAYFVKDISTDSVDSKLFCYLKSKLINLLLFPPFPNSQNLRTNFPNSKGPGPQIQISRKITAHGLTCCVCDETCSRFNSFPGYYYHSFYWLKVSQEFEDTKGVIRIRISKKTTQWPKEKVQKDKQRSTKHTHKTKDRVTRTPLYFSLSDWIFVFGVDLNGCKLLILSRWKTFYEIPPC